MRLSTKYLFESSLDLSVGTLDRARSLEGAVSNYGRFQTEPIRPFFGQLTCPTEQLPNLGVLLKSNMGLPKLSISVIAPDSVDRTTWEEILEGNAKLMNDFQLAVDERAEIVAYEIRLPHHLNVPGYLRDLSGFSDVEVFVDVPLTEGFEDTLALIAETEWLAAKTRVDRLRAPTTVATFLRSCIDLELSFKLRVDGQIPLSVVESDFLSIGYMNLLVAGVLGMCEDLSRREMEKLLGEPTLQSFDFSEGGLAWSDKQASLESIKESREFFVAIESTDFDVSLFDKL